MNKKSNYKNSEVLSNILNKLKSKSFDKSDLLGVTCLLIYNKDIFPKNKDIRPFLDKIFNITFLDYVFKSRTLIVARTTKHIFAMNDGDITNLQTKLLNYFQANKKVKSKQSTKRNANAKLETWLERL